MGLYKRARIALCSICLFVCSCSVRVQDNDTYESKPDFLAMIRKDPPREVTTEKPEQAPLAHIMYRIGQGDFQGAIGRILEEKKQNPHLLHTDLLQKIGLAILEEGMQSGMQTGMQANNTQNLAATLYGIRIAQDERLIPLIENALHTSDPHLQLIALSVLASFETEQADTLLQEAMKSNYIFVRLEAAFILAYKHRPLAYEQLEALMHKLDAEFRPIFPKLFALEASPHAQDMLKRLLFDEDILVRSEALTACADFHRDDLLDEIRKLASDPHPIQQEAAAYALGSFKDSASKEILKKIASNKTSTQYTASLAALWALYQLGEEEAKNEILAYAKTKNLFAIRLLANIADTNAFLIECLADDDVSVRVNATLSLLEKRDRACLANLATLLVDSPSDYTFQPLYSPGKTLTACKAVSSSHALYKNEPLFFELSLRFRESVLANAAELAESDFLSISEMLLTLPQKDLIPCCISILQNIRTENTITLLKKNVARLGSPYIRAWCALALFRLHIEGPFTEQVKAILVKHNDDELFQSRPILPWRMRQDDEPYSLTLQESQRLLIEAYQAFAEAQNEEGIDLLLKAICDKKGHTSYALAGLLMRSAL